MTSRAAWGLRSHNSFVHSQVPHFLYEIFVASRARSERCETQTFNCKHILSPIFRCIIRECHKKVNECMRMTIIAFRLAAEDWLWIIYLMYLEFYGILNQNLNFMSFVSNAVRDLPLIFDNFYSPKNYYRATVVVAGPLNTHFIRFLNIYFSPRK